MGDRPRRQVVEQLRSARDALTGRSAQGESLAPSCLGMGRLRWRSSPKTAARVEAPPIRGGMSSNPTPVTLSPRHVAEFDVVSAELLASFSRSGAA